MRVIYGSPMTLRVGARERALGHRGHHARVLAGVLTTFAPTATSRSARSSRWRRDPLRVSRTWWPTATTRRDTPSGSRWPGECSMGPVHAGHRPGAQRRVRSDSRRRRLRACRSSILAIFGSILAFGSFLTLDGAGGGRASRRATVRRSMECPIVALRGSRRLFEGYRWEMLALVGVAVSWPATSSSFDGGPEGALRRPRLSRECASQLRGGCRRPSTSPARTSPGAARGTPRACDDQRQNEEAVEVGARSSRPDAPNRASIRFTTLRPVLEKGVGGVRCSPAASSAASASALLLERDLEVRARETEHPPHVACLLPAELREPPVAEKNTSSSW